MKHILRIVFFFAIIMLASACRTQDNYDLTTWPEGYTPQETGLRLAEKYLATPHKSSGDVTSMEEPTQIVYSEACTWLGSLWFADATDNTDLLARLEERIIPLGNEKQYLLPLPTMLTITSSALCRWSSIFRPERKNILTWVFIMLTHSGPCRKMRNLKRRHMQTGAIHGKHAYG